MSFIISYDNPTTYTDWNRPVIAYGSVEKALLQLGGHVDPLGLKTTIRYRPASSVTHGQIKAAVRKALEPFDGAALIVDRNGNRAWTWPSPQFRSRIGRAFSPWIKRSL